MRLRRRKRASEPPQQLAAGSSWQQLAAAGSSWQQLAAAGSAKQHTPPSTTRTVGHADVDAAKLVYDLVHCRLHRLAVSQIHMPDLSPAR